MARQVRRISELPEAGPLTGDELLEIVQDGENHRVRVDELPGGGGGAVQSVQGRTGDVVITADDVGLGSVDNTSDADKPVSTAQQAALDGKVDKLEGKGLSEEDFTTALRDKLDSLNPGSGGIDSIVAGSGITVDDSDPVNPIVSATGSGGGGGVESIVAGNGINVDDSDPANPVISATGSAGAEVNVQTGTAYTLVLTDAFKMVTMDNAGANTLTVPPNSTVAFPANTRIDIGQDGAGQTTIVAGAGVTIRTPEALKLRKQWSKASLIRRATDVWDLVGDLEAEV